MGEKDVSGPSKYEDLLRIKNELLWLNMSLKKNKLDQEGEYEPVRLCSHSTDL